MAFGTFTFANASAFVSFAPVITEA